VTSFAHNPRAAYRSTKSGSPVFGEKLPEFHTKEEAPFAVYLGLAVLAGAIIVLAAASFIGL
jgi:hypothetical protein